MDTLGILCFQLQVLCKLDFVEWELEAFIEEKCCAWPHIFALETNNEQTSSASHASLGDCTVPWSNGCSLCSWRKESWKSFHAANAGSPWSSFCLVTRHRLPLNPRCWNESFLAWQPCGGEYDFCFSLSKWLKFMKNSGSQLFFFFLPNSLNYSSNCSTCVFFKLGCAMDL